MTREKHQKKTSEASLTQERSRTGSYLREASGAEVARPGSKDSGPLTTADRLAASPPSPQPLPPWTTRPGGRRMPHGSIRRRRRSYGGGAGGSGAYRRSPAYLRRPLRRHPGLSPSLRPSWIPAAALGFCDAWNRPKPLQTRLQLRPPWPVAERTHPFPGFLLSLSFVCLFFFLFFSTVMSEEKSGIYLGEGRMEDGIYRERKRRE